MTGQLSRIQRFSVGDGEGIRSTVFLKGCPLHCPWCHNPETQPITPVLMFYSSRCTLCGKCTLSCPNGVHSIIDSKHLIDRSKCISCGKCVKNCFNDALDLDGKTVTVEDVVKIVSEDEEFYAASNGGVTLSGGEPLLQLDFTLELMKQLCEGGIHVLCDTSAQCKTEDLERVIKYCKTFYVDVKANSEESHSKTVGGSFKRVLENITFLVNNGCDVTVRIPVIPNHNDSIEYLKKVAEAIAPTGVKKVDLLPFHSLCKSKYESIGEKFAYGDVESLSRADVEPLKAAFDGFEVRVTN
ncbi:MAG: glycyl-radical enzyme activating protein [Clostridiales bacterium]|nr:glycyl-radical enzyme activating protein [Clostridiales bacterium]